MTLPRTRWATIDFRIAARVIGSFASVFALTMLVPLLVGLLDGEDLVGGRYPTLFGFGLAAAVSLLVGTGLGVWGRGSTGEFFRREGILAVAGSWFLVGLLGSLPFLLSGALDRIPDAVFESISGLTTTGSSVLGAGGNPAIEELPPSLLFWRAALHWIGGLGIVVMFLIFLPALGITEKTLFQAEVAGVSKEGLRPRIRHSALTLLRIYLAITAILGAAYWILGMNLFEATCHAFATIATGGFSTRNYSVGEFNSTAIELVTIAGMFVAAVNFGLYHKVVRLLRPAFDGWRLRWRALPSPRALLQVFTGDAEFRLYGILVLGAIVVITLTLLGSGTFHADAAQIGRDHDYATLGASLRDGAFQAVSLSSCCGYANSDILRWPVFAQAVLILIMILGASSGSTGGGLKAARVLVIFKLVNRSVNRFLRPRTVKSIRIGGVVLDDESGDRILALCVTWVLVLVAGALLMLLLAGVDVLTAFTAAATAMSNCGPGLTTVPIGAGANDLGIDIGSYGSFGALPAAAKGLLCVLMVLGRLEIYTVFAVLHRSFWRD